MYQEFLVSVVSTDIRNKTLTIEFSNDIDPASIDDATIQIINRSTRDIVDYSFEVKGKAVSIILLEWPIPNQEYILKVDKLKNILGDILVSGIRKKIIFESSLCSTVTITNPAFNEIIKEMEVKWIEEKQDTEHELVNSYYIEIADDTNFYRLVHKTLVTDQNEVELPALSRGQYFVRCRVQKDEQYGFWSETVSFLVDKTPAKPEAIFDEEDDEPIFIDDMRILTVPKNGETPESILIEFDCNIDSDFLDNIVIIRRDY